jgi:hypothetical protein
LQLAEVALVFLWSGFLLLLGLILLIAVICDLAGSEEPF